MQDKSKAGTLVPVADEPPPFTKIEARKFTDSIRADVTALWLKIKEAHDRRAWQALGYESFADYMRKEFDYGKAHAYRLLSAGQIIYALSPPPPLPALLESPIGDSRDEALSAEWREHRRREQMDYVLSGFPRVSEVPLPTRQAQSNALNPIAHDHELLRATWRQVIEQYGPNPTGRQVREVVSKQRGELRTGRFSPEELAALDLPYRLQRLNDCILDPLDGAIDLLGEALDDAAWPPDDGQLGDAPPVFLDRWRADLSRAQETIAEALRRLS
jgi:hypothetical protein